jgi:hypothetical protein
VAAFRDVEVGMARGEPAWVTEMVRVLDEIAVVAAARFWTLPRCQALR